MSDEATATRVAKQRRLPKPTKLTPIDVEIEPEEEEDVLDRFTDPTKKRKRKEKKEQYEEDKKFKLVNAGKRQAKNEFNTPPSAAELELWLKYVEQPVPTLADLENLQKAADSMTIEAIGYTCLPKTAGFYAVMDCITAMVHCKTWLNERLARVGWKTNMTGYEPVAVSHSTNEVLPATLECYRMAVKQMIQCVTYSTKTSETQ